MVGWVIKNQKKAGWLVAGIIALIVILDQLLKFYIKLNFRLGESFEIFPWFQICFVENNGMAFGMEWGHGASVGKLCLTLFRILAVGVLGWYIHQIIKRGAHTCYLVLIALITAGALGNIFDCLLYGLIFSPSTPYEVATMVPFGQGYGDFFFGKVVDMFYFPLIHDASGNVLFFNAIFNVADSAITVAVGVLLVLMCCRKDIVESAPLKKQEPSE